MCVHVYTVYKQKGSAQKSRGGVAPRYDALAKALSRITQLGDCADLFPRAPQFSAAPALLSVAPPLFLVVSAPFLGMPGHFFGAPR